MRRERAACFMKIRNLIRINFAAVVLSINSSNIIFAGRPDFTDARKTQTGMTKNYQ